MRPSTRAFIILALSILSSISTVSAVSADQKPPGIWATTAERTGFRQTSSYEQTLDYCRRLAKASPWVRLASFGTTPQGRSMPYLVVSRDRAFTRADARRARKPVVLIQNGIHAGEIDGKEASLALVREIAVTHTLESLVDHATLVVVPIFNVDGHERTSPYNRINQDGPESKGWRATAQGLNLNRDYMKADAPEMRALIELVNEWRPDLVVDTHVTDGADFQYDVLYTIEANGYVAPQIATYVTEVIQPAVRPAMERRGHVVESYFNLRDETDLSKGIERQVFPPRFSNGYFALRNRPVVLVETHMLKSFEQRIRATYDLLVEILRVVNEKPAALLTAVRSADDETIAEGRVYDPTRMWPLRLEITDKSRTIRFRGREFTIAPSEISGANWVQYSPTPRDLDVPLFDEVRAAVSVAPPLAYVIPPEWTAAIDRVTLHDLRTWVLPRAVTAEFESYRLTNPTWSPQPFEGRHPARFTVQAVTEQRTLPAGSIVVPMDQPGARLAMHLLEPAAPDSLAAWGVFDAIFEQKEYAEGYVLEKLAREMLAREPALKREFEERMAADKAFRDSPQARLQFFFERSPYWDSRLGAYPVVRVTKPLP